VEIWNFTPNLFADCRSSILSIAEDQPEEYWEDKHFLMDLPRKWDFSFVVMNERQPVGYAILSTPEAGRLHLHHFMASPSSRGSGLGSQMLEEVVTRGKNSACRMITLKVARSSERSQKFYLKRGFSVMDQLCSDDYLFLQREIA